ncbi:FAD-binding oxidoreductase [Acinetobacter sp. B10A]|uniref:NAD(P)/FAD-dependent oxidoreductase n=1 Tax=Acinetobacter baretiae TaxID=2605383 RepID=UPI001B3C70D2|nr:FAD-dependent oxidoreductase [Acinetobacter baretiae]MBF7685600.1 FAD-binding oxidoreductase [Acinetobacter baretiae]
MNPDVIIVGAGIIGAACAYELAKNGRSVHIIDAKIGGATSAGMGHLVIIDDLQPELELTAWSVRLWHSLAQDLTTSCAFKHTPTLWLASSEDELKIASEKYERLIKAGVRCQLVNQKALYQLEPHLKKGLLGGLKVLDDGLVYAPAAAQWFIQQYPHLIQVTHAKVAEIKEHSIILDDGCILHTQHIIVANGIHATDFFTEFPIVAKKGHLAITDRYPDIHINHTLVALAYAANTHASSGVSVACNIQPRPTGQLFIGSSRQFDNTDSNIEPEVMLKVLNTAVDYLPLLADLNILRTWTGLRAATPDGLPIIGKHPHYQSIYLAIGHEGLGVTTATGTAQIIASMLCDLPLNIAIDSFSAERFIGDHHGSC